MPAMDMDCMSVISVDSHSSSDDSDVLLEHVEVIDLEVIDLDPESEDEDVDELPMFGPEPPDHPLKVHCRTPSPCFWSCELCAGFVCDTCGGCCYCCTCSLMREHESDASFH